VRSGTLIACDEDVAADQLCSVHSGALCTLRSFMLLLAQWYKRSTQLCAQALNTSNTVYVVAVLVLLLRCYALITWGTAYGHSVLAIRI
jgi:hypothetical protein